MKKLKFRPKVHHSLDDFKTQLHKANAFFNDPKLPSVVTKKSKSSKSEDGNKYADKDGLIEFVFGAGLDEDPVVTKTLLEQKKIMIAITSIVTDYVNRYAAVYGPEYKTDAELWELALSQIPLMGPSAISEQVYTKRLRGISIATDFIKFIMDIVSGEGAAMNKFNEYLENQGDAIRFGIEENKDYYKAITVGVSLEVFMVGKEIVYVPKIKQYRVDWTRENTKWTSACASAEYVNINFKYFYAANVFDYEALEDPAIKKDFENFIRDQRKAQIENSDTFFNGDFPPPKSAV